MNLLTRYMIGMYAKYFGIVFVALEAFFVFVDLMKYLDNLPNSANLMVLLVFYDFLYASHFILSLSLVLSLILLCVMMIKSQQLTSLLALGYSKITIFIPVFCLGFVMTLVFIGLNFTPFAYAKEKVDLIIDRAFISDYKTDVFVKYNQYFVYFGKIFPLLKAAENIKIYQIDENNLELFGIIESKYATFDNQKWILQDALITSLPKELHLGQNPLITTQQSHFEILEGFRPKILDNIYEKQGNISILDAFEGIKLLQKQQINTDKLRATLYILIIFPFFAPFVMMLLIRFVPNFYRYSNIGWIAFFMILGVLMAWGFFFGMSRLSLSGLVNPELSILLPMALLGFGSLYGTYQLYRK